MDIEEENFHIYLKHNIEKIKETVKEKETEVRNICIKIEKELDYNTDFDD